VVFIIRNAFREAASPRPEAGLSNLHVNSAPFVVTIVARCAVEMLCGDMRTPVAVLNSECRVLVVLSVVVHIFLS
jgi:hypothetical protein